jgi:hypothetical protein
VADTADTADTADVETSWPEQVASAVVARPTVLADPAKVVRTAWTAFAVLDATTAGPLDVAARRRAGRLVAGLLAELRTALTAEGVAELVRLVPHTEAAIPTEGELRILEAQLVGWLEGLMDGEQLAAWGAAVEAASRLAGAVAARQDSDAPDERRATAPNPGSGTTPEVPAAAAPWRVPYASPYL